MQPLPGADTPMTIFDAIIAGTAPASIVYRDDHFISFLDIRPMAAGHLLVCPLQAVDTLDQLDAPTQAGLWQLAIRLATAQRHALGSRAQHFLVNDGRAASQSVPHVHIHVIPRYRRDALPTMGRMIAHVGLRMLPMPVSARKRAHLDAQAAAIRAAL